MLKTEADISPIYQDARGSTARPYCCRIGFPSADGRGPKYRYAMIVRASNPEDAKALRKHLIAERRRSSDATVLIAKIKIIQADGWSAQRAAQTEAYKAKQETANV